MRMRFPRARIFTPLCRTLIREPSSQPFPCFEAGTIRSPPPPAPNFARFEKEIAAFEESDRASPPPTGAVLFIGASRVRLWSHLAEEFPDVPILNRAFGGSDAAGAWDWKGAYEACEAATEVARQMKK